jgi:steroid delta-isomerase-like uncharacterized protein
VPVKESKALVRHLIKELNKGKAAAMATIDELYASEVVFHNSHGKDIRGLKNFKQYNSDFFSAVPDVHITIEDMIAEGDKIVTCWTMTGTHKGEMGGIPPTNKKLTLWIITVDRIAGGKFVEEWERYDTLGLMQQLGLVPKPRQD